MEALEDPFFTETITVCATSVGGSDAHGTPIVTRTPRTGLVDVPAAYANVQNGKIIQREEERRTDLTRVSTWYRLQTPGAHWEIEPSDEVLWRGDYWNVNSRVVDASGTYTEILVELVEPRPT